MTDRGENTEEDIARLRFVIEGVKSPASRVLLTDLLDTWLELKRENAAFRRIVENAAFRRIVASQSLLECRAPERNCADEERLAFRCDPCYARALLEGE